MAIDSRVSILKGTKNSSFSIDPRYRHQQKQCCATTLSVMDSIEGNGETYMPCPMVPIALGTESAVHICFVNIIIRNVTSQLSVFV